MISVRIRQADQRRVEQALEGIKDGAPRAMSAAVQRTIEQARSRVVKAVASDITVPQNKLYEKGNKRRPIRQFLFRQGMTVTGGKVEVSGSRLPLGRFKLRQIKGGVSYQITKGEGRRKLKDGAFFARFSSGYEGAFKRFGKSRTPLIELHGPSIPHVALNRPVVKKLMRVDFDRILQKNINQQIQRILEGKKARRG